MSRLLPTRAGSGCAPEVVRSTGGFDTRRLHVRVAEHADQAAGGTATTAVRLGVRAKTASTQPLRVHPPHRQPSTDVAIVSRGLSLPQPQSAARRPAPADATRHPSPTPGIAAVFAAMGARAGRASIQGPRRGGAAPSLAHVAHQAPGTGRYFRVLATAARVQATMQGRRAAYRRGDARAYRPRLAATGRTRRRR